MSLLFDLEIKIKTKEDALKVVQGASMVFLVIAGWGAIAASYLSVLRLMNIDMGIYLNIIDLRYQSIAIFLVIVLAVLLRTKNSRVVAVLLLLYSLANIIGKIHLSFTYQQASLGMYFAVLNLFSAIRAIQATFLLHGKFSRR